MSTERDYAWPPATANAASIDREQLLGAALDGLSEGVVACNADRELIYFNRSTTEFHGLSAAPVSSDSWADYYSLHRADGTRMTESEVPLLRALAGEKLHDVVMVIAPAEVESRTVLCSGGPIHDHDGNLLGAVVVMRDITAEIIAERHKGDAAHERELNRAKDEFLATLAHELRTPLTSILGWTQMLRFREEEASRALAAIEQSTRMQAQLIEDLSDISRITAGKFLLKLERLSLSDVIDSAVTAVRPSAEIKRITMARSESSQAVFVNGDALRLQQVFWNLLTNAIKFTPDGGTVRLKSGVTGKEVRIDIEDTGAGFSADFLPMLFGRYMQGPEGRAFGSGLGIGLSIARSIVELHEGSIGASSEGPGHGATFSVILPVA
ncbi:MAG: hypothetical protein NVSMB68_05460 [Thermoanaerobaculia bacterium]